MRQEFPGSGALQDAPGEAFLAGGTEQAAVKVAELTSRSLLVRGSPGRS